ncbi:DUF1330 domain-containing protein [Candidatus Hydrogenedentota bacterium]
MDFCQETPNQHIQPSHWLVPLTLQSLDVVNVVKNQEESMHVYMIIQIEIKNRELYFKYVENVREIVESHGGRYLIRGGEVTPVAGNWHPERIIVIEFETAEALRSCFSSPEYRQIAPLREQSAIGKSIMVEGCSPPCGGRSTA